MQIHDLAKSYQTKTDEELLQLAASPEQLTPEAHSVLTSELASRRIDLAEGLEAHADEVEKARTRGLPHPSVPSGVSEFVEEVLRVYGSQFWFFIKLVAPAVVVGYIAVRMGLNEGREIARQLLRVPVSEIVRHRTEFIEIWLANSAGYLVSWMAFSFSFGAICFAVDEIKVGVTPSVTGSFGAISHRLGPFLRLSLLLFFMILAAEGVGGLLFSGVFWTLRHGQIHPGRFAISALTYGLGGLALLVMSRFGLAMPALLLDDYRVGQAMFRSDELTEGKWLTLAALLAKSLIGGYVVGMFPFWMASFIPADARLPPWFPWTLTTASIAGVTVVEPTMFIGFALLYLKNSAV
ncbi:MAG: hypothetical protein WAO17_03240, partial [Candidatus Sulfotelmatobacter sp.]